MNLHARTSRKALWVTLVLHAVKREKLLKYSYLGIVQKKFLCPLPCLICTAYLLIILSSRSYPISCSLVMNVNFGPFIFHHRYQHCVWTVHNCHYAYSLCITVTMCTDCAQLSLCVQTVHNCHYKYRLCTTVTMCTDSSQLSLCVQTV